MTVTLELSPVAWLAHLEKCCLSHASSLPQQEETDLKWSGIGFRLADTLLVSPLGEVSEVLPVPALSNVPRSRHWVLGMSNIRGNLMPVIDLKAFLNGEQTRLSGRSRVLIISHNEITAGLVVDDVLGLQHFVADFKCDEVPNVNREVQQYITHGFRVGNEHWAVFSMHQLAEAQDFLQAAI